jgi:serine/threonine protein kinase
MPDPRPQSDRAAGPPETETGEWAGLPPAEPTLTVPNTGSAVGDLGIPNPFGRYRITHLLGRGGMGAVFLAHDTQLDRPVAVKVPTFEGALTVAQKERFFREARAIAALRHPNICPVFDVGEEQGFLFLTMAYIDGRPLADLVARGPMPQDRAVDLVRRVARAMHEAHVHGTIHRDLKPANILIDKNGEPVVMDFGLARRTQWKDDARADPAPGQVSDAALTQAGSVMGTPAYMPPEQARGDAAAIGPRSDLYALGVILYELLSGRRPFTSADPTEFLRRIETDSPPRLTEFYPWIDKGVEAACLKALAKDPAQRFATMAEFERALKEAVEPTLEVVVPPPLPKPTPHPRRRRWVKLAGCLGPSLLFLTLCVGIPVGAVWWYLKGAFPRQPDWDIVADHWPAPAYDAAQDTLLPSMIDDRRFLLRDTNSVPNDADLGITVPGRKGVYEGPDGKVEVRFYRCPEAEAKKVQQRVVDIYQTRGAAKAAIDPKAGRNTASFTSQDGIHRKVTYEFHDRSAQAHEYGLVWYGGGWLYWFQAGDEASIQTFPSRFLLEVGRRASGLPETRWR